MPQMALGGLSEAWLFRELGDIHWTMISNGLAAPSSKLADANGHRLYATFTRIRMTSTVPLQSYHENEDLLAEGKLTRFGAGIFFGDITMSNGSRKIRAELMSSFTKRSNSDSNLSLLKGQPAIPGDCSISNLAQMPQLAQEYRQTKAANPGKVIFETRYDILPYHDINGVGLLYFAAYPTINDLCEIRYIEDSSDWCLNMGTVLRDVYYFGNCEIDDKITFRVHSFEYLNGSVRSTSSLSRASDGVMIAYLVTEKARVV
jgi:probable biosynthetic protein (TIGR04098 family)